MAHLWVKDASQQPAALPLEGEAYTLLTDPPRPLAEPSRAAADEWWVWLLRAADSWVLLAAARAEVRVNGVPLAFGMRVLRDRDEISVGGAGTRFFSTESLAAIVAFPCSPKALFCPRCKQPLEEATSTVRCPSCRVWHHQAEDLNCWTYAPACALCPHPTALDAGFQWTPDEL